MQSHGNTMFAIGHFALGYLTGKGSSKAAKTKPNLQLLLVASVLPDVDLVLQVVNDRLFMHRGPTHSIITVTVLMIPFFFLYRKQAIPYFVALLSHPLVGDLPTGGIEMLWPATRHWFGSSVIQIGSLADVVTEFALFAVTTSLMFKAGDLKELWKPKSGNLLLIIAFAAVLGPMLEISQGSDAALPLLLIPASAFWLVLFAYSIIRHLRGSGARKATLIHAETQK